MQVNQRVTLTHAQMHMLTNTLTHLETDAHMNRRIGGKVYVKALSEHGEELQSDWRFLFLASLCTCSPDWPQAPTVLGNPWSPTPPLPLKMDFGV